jgi:hypothetical protein
MATVTPKKNLATGLEPDLGLNSPLEMAATKAPITKAKNSGLAYWTVSARWRPKEPTTSRPKQATHNPMFPGLPNFCNTAAPTPIITPAMTIPEVDEKGFFIKFL